MFCDVPALALTLRLSPQSACSPVCLGTRSKSVTYFTPSSLGTGNMRGELT